MISVTNYREFNEEIDAPSVVAAVSNVENPHKRQILDYMKSFEEDVVCPIKVQDAVTGKSTEITLVYYTDGEFIWDERDIYHFEKYNISLNEHFLKKVM